MPLTYQAGAIDTDVHCAPAAMADLHPYLSDYWRQYIAEAGVTLNGVANAYPKGAATSARSEAREQEPPAVPSSHDQLKSRYLEAADPQLAVLHCLTGFETHRNPYYAAAMASAINDWVRAEFLERDDRLRASIVVSTLSPEDAVAEIERVGDDPGFVQVLLPVRSDVPWGNKNNHPIFAAAQAHTLQVGLHAWGRSGRAPTPSGFTTSYLEDYVANQPIAQAQLLSLVAEGVFNRFPDLRVLLLECGFAWLPPLLWRFDKDWKGVWREVPWIKVPPSEYVRKHIRLSTAPAHLPPDAQVAAELVQMLGGVDMLAYASDYPHEHGADLSALLAGLGDAQRDAVLRDNAASFYAL
jgi:hypothetical protein